MRRLLNDKQGFVFILVILVIVFVIGLSAVFFMRATSEKRFVDLGKYIMQANFLGEAGANHGLSELKERIWTDLSAKVGKVKKASDISKYDNDPLGFLVEYADDGVTQFELSDSEAHLPLPGLNLQKDFDGDYSSEIIITAPVSPDVDEETNVYVFYYNYLIEGTGSSVNISQDANNKVYSIFKKTYLMGNFSVTVRQDDFARYALLTHLHRSGPGGNPVWFSETTNFYGPVHTNDEFSFAGSRPLGTSASFLCEVSQKQNKARFYNDGEPILLDRNDNPPYDMPNFAMGFQRGVPLINIQGAVDDTDLSRQAWGGNPPQGGASGIYVNVQGGALTGGIYIRGDASVNLTTTDNGPQYTIIQGGTTKVITVNYAANSTTVTTNGVPAPPYIGIPDGQGDEGVIIYARDNITSFSGTVERNTTMTVAAHNDLVISGNVEYQDTSGSPPSTSSTNMLGIVSTNGNVRIGSAAPDNVKVHGIVVAPHGVFTVDNYNQGNPRGTATLFGGVITEYYGAFGTSQGGELLSGYGKNSFYDDRVLACITPPFFPEMKNFISIESGLSDRPLWSNKEAVAAE